MEKNPMQALTVNAIGSAILAEVSLKFEVERFVQVSTDKAVNPTNIMGASKRAAELYIQSLQIFSKTKFVTTRFGNVLGSNGSVVPFFREQIAKGGPITVTHPDIERYFMTIPEACSLVLEAGAMSSGGEIFVFDMGEPVKIKDLAERMIRLSGLEPYRDIEISYIGLRPGEKLYEELLSNSENTLPTYHNQILIAKVDKKAYKDLVIAWEELKQLVNSGTQQAALDWLRRLVPEFETQEVHLNRVLNLEEEPDVPMEIEVSPYLLSRRKRFLDLSLSLMALPFILLLLLLTALIHPFFAGLPFFYYQLRMGRGYKAFTLYKIRTLKLDHNNIRAGMRNTDGTVIPVIGRFLRTYKIDETPQVWNIIKGDMSWVGPRPEQMKVAESFIEQYPKYAERHKVLPGITGLAQLDDPNAALDDFEEKLYHDFKYIKTASLYLDLYILFRSFVVVLRSSK
jgi:lipopolysaccharide/colanic/teichoic acid biosynthesis glycosyltransferase